MHALFAKLAAGVAIWATGIVGTFGYPGILLLMTICGTGLPLPSEIILPLSGLLAAQGKFTLLGIGLVGAVGENIGGAVAYEVGKRGGRGFVTRYGRYVLLDLHHLERAERFFARFGRSAVLVGRMLPVVRAFVALPAGAVRMPRLQFHIYTTLGSFAWCFGFAWIGLKLGRAWDRDPRIRALFESLDVVLLVLAGAAIGFILWRKLRPARA